MKFLARGEAAFKDRTYLKQGAGVYFSAKLIAIFYYLHFVECAACSDSNHFIIRGLIHAVLFSHFIYIGLLMAVRILAWTSFFRTSVFIINIFVNSSVVITVPFIDFDIEILSHSSTGGFVFIVPAVLNALISLMLVRALVKGRDLKKKKVADGADVACPFSKHTKKGGSGKPPAGHPDLKPS